MTQSSSVERLVGEIDEFGYTVVEDVLDADSVAAYLADTRRLERELPTVIANSTTVVKGLARPGHVPVDRVDHDWVRIDNLLLHGTRYEALPVHPKLLPVIEGVLGRDCLLSWCMTSNQLPGAVAQRLMAPRRVGAFSARVRYASSAATSRLLVAVLAAIRPPARQGPTRCRRWSGDVVRPQRGGVDRRCRTVCVAAVWRPRHARDR